MTKLVNRAKMTTATTGTGTITLGSAVDGYQTFANAGVANADVVRYVIEDGNAWEIGLGTYTASGTTLTRGSIESSTGTALNLTGNAVVYVSAAAGDLQELVDFADNFTLPTADGTTGQVLTTNGSGVLTFTSPGASLAGQTDSASPFETSLGFEAGLNTTGVNNTFVGYQAGKENTAGANNTAVGFRALDVNTTSTENTAVGVDSMGSLTGGAGSNTAVGVSSLRSLTTGNFNTALGVDALLSVTTGYNLVGLGDAAGRRSATSFASTYVGSSAGRNSNGAFNIGIGFYGLTGSNTSPFLTGEYNVGIGVQTANSMTTANHNFLGGYRAGYVLTTGSDNVAIGRNAGDTLTTGANNVLLGNGATASSATVSNEITLGNSSITRFRVPGVGFQFDTTDGLIVPKTITAGGTTGAQTINKTAGSVNFAAAATSLVVTNSFVDANSVIIATVATNDTTMKSVAVVAGAGSFTIHADTAPTAETRVNWFVAN
jgi:hypothetical protein